jgi:hypothetical protein
MLRRFERAGPGTRSFPELVKQLEHNQGAVRLPAIKFLARAGPSAKEVVPALDRMRKDLNAEYAGRQRPPVIESRAKRNRARTRVTPARPRQPEGPKDMRGRRTGSACVIVPSSGRASASGPDLRLGPWVGAFIATDSTHESDHGSGPRKIPTC